MSDQKIKEFLRQGTPPVPAPGFDEYQRILRHIRLEEAAPLPFKRRWPLWTVFGLSAGVAAAAAGLSLFMTIGQDDRNAEEDLFHDLNTAEWVETHQSDAYSDWLQLAEYSTIE